MAEASQRDEWDRTAVMVCRIVNGIVNAIPFRSRDVKALKIEEVHPFEKGSSSARGAPLRVSDLKSLVNNPHYKGPRAD